MLFLPATDPLAETAVRAVQRGELDVLRTLLRDHPELTTAYLGDDPAAVPDGTARTLLHIATDWPGHFPHNVDTVAVLVAAGAQLDAPFAGPHRETALHWAASSDDVAVLDALLDAGADIEAPGAVIGGGTPLADAVAFGNWGAAHRLVERGAHTTLAQAAALGLQERVRTACDADPTPGADELGAALWFAAHGGQPDTAELLLERGADPTWVAPWDHSTAAGAAGRRGATELAARLQRTP